MRTVAPDVGAVAVGMRGDGVVLEGEASKPGLSYENVYTVIKGGVIYVDRGNWGWASRLDRFGGRVHHADYSVSEGHGSDKRG